MNSKSYTQFGTISLIILLPVILFLTYQLGKTGLLSGQEAIIIAPVFVILLLVFLMMYKLTITVDDNFVSFKMGIGLIRKSYKMEDIKACYPVKNSWLLGFGIRMLSNGWLYNVSGNRAIELHFKNKNSVVRIGSDHPEVICSAILEKIGGVFSDGTDSSQKTRKINFRLIIPALVILFVAGLIVYGQTENQIKIEKDSITITGMYGLTIPVINIIQIDTISHLPGISIRTNGYALGRTLKGNFRLNDKSSVKLFIKAGNLPYILIKTSNIKPIYINFRGKQETIDQYRKLKDIKP